MKRMDTAMILAAGRGERMRPFTDVHPKPLAKVHGKPLIQYHIESLAKAGITRVVINVAWLGTQIRDAMGDGSNFGVTILYSDEGPEALETGGGIQLALPLLGSQPFWVVSADLWTDYPYAASETLLNGNDLAHLIMVENPTFHPRGDFCLQDNRVTESIGTRLTYASLAVFDPRLFEGCKPGRYSVVPLLKSAMAHNRVSGSLFTGQWDNIGTVEQLERINQKSLTNLRMDK
jgi:N-acetyl-alpha-D-muramate 1-phosphate uridylyltransferase